MKLKQQKYLHKSWFPAPMQLFQWLKYRHNITPCGMLRNCFSMLLKFSPTWLLPKQCQALPQSSKLRVNPYTIGVLQDPAALKPASVFITCFPVNDRAKSWVSGGKETAFLGLWVVDNIDHQRTRYTLCVHSLENQSILCVFSGHIAEIQRLICRVDLERFKEVWSFSV